MHRRSAAPITLLAAILFITSCTSTPGAPASGETTAGTTGTASAGASPGDKGSTTPSPTPLATDVALAPRPAPAALEAATPVPSAELDASRGRLFCPKGSQEGCHSYTDMPSYLGHVLALTAPFFDERYGVASRPAAFYFVGAGLAGPTACLKDDGSPDQYSSQDYSYCTADKAIYAGQDSLWLLYNGVGGAAPAIGYAHEWGHHIQNIKGVPAPETEEQNNLLENQADCIAGAWASHAAQSGHLKDPGDLGDMNALLAAIAPPGAGETGSPIQDRISALMQGYSNGLQSCNSFFPETPVYTG
jgi:hypothetical protein